ncbi:hypothetical protein ACVW1A_002491 [Bradyrhizobium sp. LB1.3]
MRAVAQRRDRNDHAAGEQRAGEDRDQQAHADQQRDAHQLVADRHQGLRGRLLEHHTPAELRHDARGAHHRMAVEVGARRVGLVAWCDRGRHLRQLRQILADIGALRRRRQHAAARIDHIGEGGLADLGVGEVLGEKAEVELGHGDAGVETGMRHRDRHERRPVGEPRRRVADAAGDGVGEAHVAGEVGIAAGRGRLARDAQHLAALAVELEQLVDDRDLVQQLGVVGAALLERVLARPRHPADLALELGDRLLDPSRGSLRLVLETVGQLCLGGAVGDPALHRPVDGEHEHDEADERDDVFGEQALAQKPCLLVRSRHPDPLAPPSTPALRPVRAQRSF